MFLLFVFYDSTFVHMFCVYFYRYMYIYYRESIVYIIDGVQ